MLAQVQKEAVRIAISLNPTTVYVKRKEYVPDGGGRKLVESEPGEHVILLYTRFAGQTELAETAGRRDKVAWVALADDEADLKWGANVTDEFEVEGVGKFRIVEGQPVQAEGGIAGYHLILEKVS